MSTVAENTTPPLYSFEIPVETPTPTLTRPADPYLDDENEPRLGNWDVPAASPAHERSPFDFSAAQRDSADLSAPGMKQSFND